MTKLWIGRRVVKGNASGPALVSRTPLSFLGDIDIRTGRVVGQSSDLAGRTIGGVVLVVPATRGSAGAWRFIYQLNRHGTHPAAILTEDLPDPSVVQGAIMSGIPVVAGVARRMLDEIDDGACLRVCGEKARIEM